MRSDSTVLGLSFLTHALKNKIHVKEREKKLKNLGK